MQVALKLTPAEMLSSLYRLRWCAVGCALVFLATARFVLGIGFAPALPLMLIAAMAGWNLLIGLRLRRGWAATELEGFCHLAMDTLALSALLYWLGGATSPFVSLYLIPIAIAAASLPKGYAWGVTALAAGIYSLLLFDFPPLAHGLRDGFAMHVLGMWATFLLGALLLMVFVAGMAATVRRHHRALADAREQMLRNEQVTALGALAAGAAHELGTPLSTMAIIVAELREEHPDHPGLAHELTALEQQIALCKNQVDQLLGVAEHARGEDTACVPLRAWLEAMIDRWRLMRPEMELALDLQPLSANPEVMPDASLAQSLINLLNNAADASLENGTRNIGVTAACDAGHVTVTIEDEGKGIGPADTARAGRLRFSSKGAGRGLGLVLSHVSLERFGGEVSLDSRSNGGTRTRVNLPLERLRPQPA